MEYKEAETKINELLNFKLPRWHELPDFDIYMDQVVFFINQQLDVLNISDSDKPITSSMVNNYVKNSIVKAPIKKHYKRYHLAFLIVVTVLKRVYSLSEISQMIAIQTKMKDSNLELAYDTFGTYFEESLKEMFEKGHLDNARNKAANDYQLLLLNIIQSVVLKLYAEIRLSVFDSEKELNKDSDRLS